MKFRRAPLVWMCILALCFVGAAAMRSIVSSQPPPELTAPEETELPTPSPSPPPPPSPAGTVRPPSSPQVPEESPQESQEPEPEPEPEEPEQTESPPEPEESPSPEESPTPEPTGETVFAPDFTVTDGSGNRVRLSDFRGRPVVFNFWASWCEPCVGEMDAIEEVWRDYGDDVVFLMINIVTYETADMAQYFITNHRYTFPVFFDTEGKQAAAAYGVTNFPSTFWVDARGAVVSTRVGKMTEAMMRERIALIL